MPAECLDRCVEACRLRRICLECRDDHQHTRAGEHHTLGDVPGDADRGDARSAGDTQILEELLGCALVDVVTANRGESKADPDENGFTPA